MYLRNSENNNYCSLKKNLQSQYVLGNNQFPGNMTKMTNLLTNHTWDKKDNIQHKR